MQKLLTIVIPTFNMQAYLHRCLDSLIVPDNLMAQLEVLVINDGSKDNSSAIAREYEAKFPFTFRLIDKENGNYGSCVNRGLTEATGKYIKILDADDWFDTENFAEFMRFISNTDVDLILSDFDMVLPDGSIKSSVCYHYEGVGDFSALEKIDDIWMHAVTYRRAIFDGLSYHQTEGISYTDQEWIFSPLTRVYRLVCFPHVVYKYLVGRDGQTMDRKVFARNISHEIKSWMAQQQAWETFEIKGFGEAKSYLWYRLFYRAQYIYSNVILDYKEGFDDAPLYAMDAYMHAHNKVLYEQLDNITSRPCLKFRYIHLWRKWHNRPIVSFIKKIESVVNRIIFHK